MNDRSPFEQGKFYYENQKRYHEANIKPNANLSAKRHCDQLYKLSNIYELSEKKEKKEKCRHGVEEAYQKDIRNHNFF